MHHPFAIHPRRDILSAWQSTNPAVVRTKIHSHSDELRAISERHHLLARQIYQLQDQLDGLRADHARMVQANRGGAKLISQALAQGFTKLDALRWQKREEEKGLRKLRIETEFGF